MLYKWDMEANAVDNMNACKGHERSVDCLAADRKGKFIASGSFDTTLKIWGGKLQECKFTSIYYFIFTVGEVRSRKVNMSYGG